MPPAGSISQSIYPYFDVIRIAHGQLFNVAAGKHAEERGVALDVIVPDMKPHCNEGQMLLPEESAGSVLVIIIPRQYFKDRELIWHDKTERVVFRVVRIS